ncbi:hypothetical protein [Cellulomonas taurus]|jgi:hypothetical protein|nr:hypothetical protein [Cellulomonas taurus]
MRRSVKVVVVTAVAVLLSIGGSGVATAGPVKLMGNGGCCLMVQ